MRPRRTVRPRQQYTQQKITRKHVKSEDSVDLLPIGERHRQRGAKKKGQRELTQGKYNRNKAPQSNGQERREHNCDQWWDLKQISNQGMQPSRNRCGHSIVTRRKGPIAL